MMGLASPVEGSVTLRLKLYLPAMQEEARKPGRHKAAMDSVPTITLDMLWKNSARESFARCGVVSNAVGGSRTWLKYVRA